MPSVKPSECAVSIENGLCACDRQAGRQADCYVRLLVDSPSAQNDVMY